MFVGTEFRDFVYANFALEISAGKTSILNDGDWGVENLSSITQTVFRSLIL